MTFWRAASEALGGAGSHGEGSDALLFSPRVRRMVVIGVAASAPLLALLGLFVHDEGSFLVAWVLVAAPYMTLALWFTATAARRSPAPHDRFWKWWLAGLTLTYLCGAFILVAVATESKIVQVLAGAMALAAIPVWMTGMIILLRSKSGLRSLSVDLLDWAIVLVAVTAPALLWVIEPLANTHAAWFALPTAIAAAVLTASVLTAGMLFLRLPSEDRLDEAVYLSLACMSALNAWLLVSQAVSGFTLPAVGLLAVQAIDMGLLLLLPVFSHRDAPMGLDRFPAHGQVRRWSATSVLVFVAVPLLALEAFALREDQPWTAMFTILVLSTLVLLATLRHVLVSGETRRLFVQLEMVAEERRVLLSSLMRAVEDDRHRVAAQLHEQAVDSLAGLGSMARASSVGLPPDAAEALGKALAGIRANLVSRAEDTRQLMLAVRSPELEVETLSTALRAYFSDLFTPGATTTLRVEVDHELVLDWTTNTILYRIAQEAIHNVWRHAEASEIVVTVSWVDDALELVIADDGRGFDPSTVLYESGLATMRLFAGLGRGSVRAERSDDGWTRIVAIFGSDEPVDAPPSPPARGRLHLVPEVGTS